MNITREDIDIIIGVRNIIKIRAKLHENSTYMNKIKR